ncbi:hypothetical protein MASR2M15_07890 [Anaerolineales bacterium]
MITSLSRLTWPSFILLIFAAFALSVLLSSQLSLSTGEAKLIYQLQDHTRSTHLIREQLSDLLESEKNTLTLISNHYPASPLLLILLDAWFFTMGDGFLLFRFWNLLCICLFLASIYAIFRRFISPFAAYGATFTVLILLGFSLRLQNIVLTLPAITLTALTLWLMLSLTKKPGLFRSFCFIFTSLALIWIDISGIFIVFAFIIYFLIHKSLKWSLMSGLILSTALISLPFRNLQPLSYLWSETSHLFLILGLFFLIFYLLNRYHPIFIPVFLMIFCALALPLYLALPEPMSWHALTHVLQTERNDQQILITFMQPDHPLLYELEQKGLRTGYQMQINWKPLNDAEIPALSKHLEQLDSYWLLSDQQTDSLNFLKILSQNMDLNQYSFNDIQLSTFNIKEINPNP